MKKTIKILTAIFFSAVATIVVGQNNRVLADDETPVVTLGTSLTDSQKDGTLKILTAPLNGGNYQTITVTGSDLVRYLNPSGDNFTTSSGVWSSAMIQKTSSGSGINVKILDYNGKNNITTITANQYKNAALTAGITDANIYVTSAIPIDGSGALAGVYAAYAKNGNALNQKQVNAAQDEMNTLSGITQDNKDKKGYSDAQLNNAVAGAKSEMAKQGQNISDSQIRDIVNNQININHLGNTINNNQKNQIVNLLIEIRDSGALKSSSFKGQASKLSSQIENSAKNIFNKFNTPENRSWLQQLWDSIVNFFSHMFGGVILG
ncbi:DUF1002 domain-containing protein [Lactobacillus amylovorus]|mgnify:FL=1|jgi:uncharacterized protein YpuA (DUF1002 family)|uniref:DUF1002 domain-containing protein n=1 Tax=Lactobacillus amylovorus TaxID=1604 RepID=UPI0006F07924|nr:DUF1002 domain-containing protein [Lactobacillus amylovorus]ATO53059.1 hypothetical protein LA20531_05110 [Lactobacillus amylovorus DSM 20531]KRK44606.1 extracellular protein [Lactobacillus amylovorus DSM 20531]MCH3997694.1 DUF1002 domain-containing protein [Lactobacillus amylovorus]MCI1531129.1 DUF1002 domain-containing protein [Lactobacillus amylovorus]MCT3585784.1 DUF1002 domain-containing protein [Lactobacillus amylovorus]